MKPYTTSSAAVARKSNAALNAAWVRMKVAERGLTQQTELLAYAAVKLGFTNWQLMKTSVFFAGLDDRQVTQYLVLIAYHTRSKEQGS